MLAVVGGEVELAIGRSGHVYRNLGVAFPIVRRGVHNRIVYARVDVFRSLCGAVGSPKVLGWGVADASFVDEKIDRAAEVEKLGRNDLRNALRAAGRAIAAPQGFREYTADALCPLEDQQVIERCTG